MFQIGDKIVHPLHGAGMIEAIVERTIDGVPTKYYALKPIAGDTQLFIPTDACEKLGIRPVCSREAAADFLNRLGGMPRSESKSWNQRYRENMLHIRSGNLPELGQVIKDLACRDRERGLSTGEKKMLVSARQILASELSIALERPLTSVMVEIDRQLTI